MQSDPNRKLGEGSGLAAATNFNDLSEDCVAKVVSFTTPRDAARVSLVSRLFKLASDSDPVWETFLPFDYRSLTSSLSPDLSKKQLYLNLCDHPILVDDGKKSLSLEKKTGKRCYMLAPRDLYIIWSGTAQYWKWISIHESRFPEVPELINVCWLEISGTINTQMLSKETLYIAYFVYKFKSNARGFVDQPVEIATEVSGGKSSKRRVILDYEVRQRRGRGIRNLINNFTSSVSLSETSSEIKERGDGWMEVELGEFFNDGDMEEELKMSVLEIEGGQWKSGLIVQGFEVRPQAYL